MKLLHCCLAAFYIDDFSYQENILPKIHFQQGYTVKILASTETYINNIRLGYSNPGSYINKDGIEVTRIPYSKIFPHSVIKKLRIYEGVQKVLNEFNPDIIFIHDCQFLSITTIADYAKKNRVRVYVDCHTDFINSGRSWLSKTILHGILYKYCAHRIDKYVTKFYGTLPLRIDFLANVYNLDRNKIELLPFGVDDTLFSDSLKSTIRDNKRSELGLTDSDFVFITGGKIDRRKNIHLFLKAFLEVKKSNPNLNIKLIVFGKPTDELYDEVINYTGSVDVQYIEWLPSREVYKYFLASDLACFPGTHSVLWEEAVGLGIPCIFYKWEGIQHVDLGGNCMFIDDKDLQNLDELILSIFQDKMRYTMMNNIAKERGPQSFSYSKIAVQALRQ